MAVALNHAIVVVLVAMLAGCVNQERTAAELQRAATATRLPKVVACWERTFEENGFTGEYLITVDFSLTDAGRIADAVVTDAADMTSGTPSPLADGGAFVECVQAALNETDLSAAKLAGPLSVRGYRIAFTDPSHDRREATSKDTPSLLVGPRADRCQGLYSHRPPRDVGLLHKLLAEARSEAAGYEKERDKLARTYQRGYDLALELRERLERDAGKADVGKEAKKRLLHELKRVDALRGDLGERIGCE